MASGDYDGDGNLDVLVGNWPNNPGPGELNWLFRNGDTDGHWLRVKLVGSAGNPGGVGARVLVTTEGVTQMREVTTQMGFRGQSDMSPHFGLGQYDSASIVEVRWPSGGESILESVAADQVVEITETPPSP